MADANRVQVSYLAESSFGVLPSSAFKAFPITGGSFATGINTVRSSQIRDDAQQADMKRVGISPTASFDFEFSAQNYDEFLKSAMRSSAWGTQLAVSETTISANSTTISIASGTPFSSVPVGSWVYVDGFTESGNNGWKRVATITSSGAGFTVSNNGGMTTESAGDTVTVKGVSISNGTASDSYGLQQQYQDLTNKYHGMLGARVNSFSLSQTPSGIITGNVAFDAKDRFQASSGQGNGSVTDAYDQDVVSEVDGFESLIINNATVSYDVMDLSINISTPNRPAKGLGSLKATRMPQGAVDVTGSFSVYLDASTYDDLDLDLQNFTKQPIAFTLNMQNSDRYCFEMPSCALTAEPATNGGVDTDIMLSFDFSAEPATSVGALEKTIVVTRVIA
jgi:hypothetical protein